MTKHVHLVKLSVGTDSVEDLAAWQAMRRRAARAEGGDGRNRHVTRMWPKRAEELLAGGSIYWVIKGAIRARQRVLALEEVQGEDGTRRCALVLDPVLHPTRTAPRRPFQGWRYLAAEDAPPDLPAGAEAGAQDDDALPEDLSRALAEIGVL